MMIKFMILYYNKILKFNW